MNTEGICIHLGIGKAPLALLLRGLFCFAEITKSKSIPLSIRVGAFKTLKSPGGRVLKVLRGVSLRFDEFF